MRIISDGAKQYSSVFDKGAEAEAGRSIPRLLPPAGPRASVPCDLNSVPRPFTENIPHSLTRSRLPSQPPASQPASGTKYGLVRVTEVPKY